MTNEMIAEHIMELKASDGKFYTTPDFLNDHNAAMMVVEKMRADGWIFELQISNIITKAEFLKCAEDGSIRECHYMFDAEASVCELICSAALKAKGIDIESKG